MSYLYEIFIQPNCIVNILAVIMNNPAFTIFVHHQCLFMKKTFYFHHDNDKYLPVENYDLNTFYQSNFIRMVLYMYQTDPQYNKCDYNLVLRLINCVCLTISIFINFKLYII